MKTDNIFDNIPQHLDEELFENLITKDGVRIQRIISQAHKHHRVSWTSEDEKTVWIEVHH